MKVLVLGGTGAMGAHLVDILAARGDAVTVTSRSTKTDSGLISYITGNAKDQAFVGKLLTKQWDAIVDFMVYSTAEFQDRLDMLLGATGHYLYLSSARVYAESEAPIDEESPRLLDVSKDLEYLATDEYALTKARQENLLFASRHKNWTIIRPYITYSANRMQLGVQEKEDWLYRALTGRSLVTSAAIQEKITTLTYGADVASGMAALLANPKAHSEAFHITAPESIRWGQVLETYLDVLQAHKGVRPRICLQELSDFTRWRKTRFQVIYDRLYNRKFNNRKIDQFIDTDSFVNPIKGLTICLEEFLSAESVSFNAINWREEAIKDRLLSEHIPLADVSGNRNKLKYILFRHMGLAQSLTRERR